LRGRPKIFADLHQATETGYSKFIFQTRKEMITVPSALDTMAGREKRSLHSLGHMCHIHVYVESEDSRWARI
jgi:hypothetical protein